MKKSIAIFFGNVIIWGVVMVACSSALSGTDAYDKIQNILIGGTVIALILNGMNLINPKGTGDDS